MGFINWKGVSLNQTPFFCIVSLEGVVCLITNLKELFSKAVKHLRYLFGYSPG